MVGVGHLTNLGESARHDKSCHLMLQCFKSMVSLPPPSQGGGIANDTSSLAPHLLSNGNALIAPSIREKDTPQFRPNCISGPVWPVCQRVPVLPRATPFIPRPQLAVQGIAHPADWVMGGEHASNVVLRQLKLWLLDLIALKKRKKRKKREYSRHNESTNTVTNLMAMSFESVSSIPFTVPGALLRLFVRLSCRGAVGHGWMVMRMFASPDQYLSVCIKGESQIASKVNNWKDPSTLDPKYYISNERNASGELLCLFCQNDSIAVLQSWFGKLPNFSYLNTWFWASQV